MNVFRLFHDRIVSVARARGLNGVRRARPTTLAAFTLRGGLCLVTALCGASLDAHARQSPAAGVAGQTKSAPVRPRRPDVGPRPPRRPAQRPVVAVVHRLRGWKLRALIAPPDAPIAATFDDNFVRTNIVAGFVLGDGRSIVARLPRAEAEMLSLPALFPGAGFGPGGEESTLVLVKQDGERIDAKFIGFDAGTGLSLLEAVQEVQGRTPELRAPQLFIGQRVRVVAPLPAEAAAAAAARPEPAPPVSDNPDGPVGDSGVLYMSLGEVEGRLKEVRRSPTGRAAAFTIQVEQVSPEWAGGVALSEAGALVGIVEQSGGRETRLLSAEAVRGAAARVKARRASVPQPWLGARGDSVADSKPEFFVAQGWPREQAWELMRRQQGVVLTAVAPDTPAARAGLRPGDVVARIENQEVRSVEDMSWILREVGGNRRAEFSILRAQNTPISLQVELSESQNPAFETARAEARGAEVEMRLADSLLFRLNENIRQTGVSLRALEETIRQTERPASQGDKEARARHAEAVERAATLRRQLDENQAKLREAMSNFALLSARHGEASTRLTAAGAGREGLTLQPLLSFGVGAMHHKTVIVQNGNSTTVKGLMVYSVVANSAAEQAGLKPGDLIETIDGHSSFELRQSLSREPRAEVTLGLLREGKRLTVNLKRAER